MEKEIMILFFWRPIDIGIYKFDALQTGLGAATAWPSPISKNNCQRASVEEGVHNIGLLSLNFFLAPLANFLPNEVLTTALGGLAFSSCPSLLKDSIFCWGIPAFELTGMEMRFARPIFPRLFPFRHKKRLPRGLAVENGLPRKTTSKQMPQNQSYKK